MKHFLKESNYTDIATEKMGGSTTIAVSYLMNNEGNCQVCVMRFPNCRLCLSSSQCQISPPLHKSWF